jgi:hypothetical protein
MGTHVEAKWNTSKKGQKNKAVKGDGTVTPDNPITTGTSHDIAHQNDATSQKADNTTSALNWRHRGLRSQETNEGSGLLAEESLMPMPAEAEGLQPSAMEGMMERLPAAETSFMAMAQDTTEMMGIFLSIHKVPYEGMVLTEMSDAMRKAQREDKCPERTGRSDKEIYNGVVAPLMQRLHASALRLGYTQREWNAYVRHLGVPMTYRREGPLVERWMTVEPPEGCSYGDWTALVCSILDSS